MSKAYNPSHSIGMKIVGNKMYDVCGSCGSIVQLNKFLLGGLHACLREEDRKKIETSQAARDLMINKIEATREALYNSK